MKFLTFLFSFLVGNFLLAQENMLTIHVSCCNDSSIIYLLVENEQGQKTGFDPETNTKYSEILNASYGRTGIEEIEYLEFLYPFALKSKYLIRLFCVGKRTDFIMEINTRRGDAFPETLIISGDIGSGEVIKYQLNFDTDPSVPITVEEIKALDPLSTIGEMIAFIDTAYAHKKIDPQGIATSLISKLEVAKEALEKEKSKESVNALNAFLNELEVQHEKHIAEEVYLYLKEKVEALIKQIGSSG